MESRYLIAPLAFPLGTPLTHVFCVLDSCHLGNIIEYDTITNLSWSVDVRAHAIAKMVEKVLAQPWAAAEELGREVPVFKRQDDCVVGFIVTKHSVEIPCSFVLLQDCFKWDFGDYA